MTDWSGFIKCVYARQRLHQSLHRALFQTYWYAATYHNVPLAVQRSAWGVLKELCLEYCFALQKRVQEWLKGNKIRPD